MRRLFVVVLACVAANAQSVCADDESFDSVVKPFLKTYCVKCHGKNDPAGERSFDRLNGDIPNDNVLADYQDMVDQLNLSEMPPSDSRQPAANESRRVITWLTNRIRRYHSTRTTSGTRLRRLNAREYRNTVRDLFALNITIFDPTINFPRDQTLHNLDNDGETLVTSGYLLQRYLEAAESVVDRALFPVEQPDVRTWTFDRDFRQQPEIDQVHRTTNRFGHMTLYDVPGADKPEGAYGPILAFRKGVPEHGIYEIRLDAEALNREHPYDDEWLGRDSSEKLRLEIVAGQDDVGDLHTKQPVEPVLAKLELEDGRQWYSARVRLDRGFTPRFTFPNGQMDMRNLYAKILRRYPKLFPKPTKRGIVGNRYTVLKHGKLPQIRIREIEIRGPLHEQWPRDSQRAAFGDLWNDVENDRDFAIADVREQLQKLLRRTYRGRVDASAVDRVLKIYTARKASGRSPIEAYRDCLVAALCSPRMVYLEQPQQNRPLSATALAARLSYFLWSSTPDAELLKAAENGSLLKTKVLRNQVERLLNDSRSMAFVDGFPDAWLGLRELGATPPERSSFQSFYQYNLDRAMRRETELFVKFMLDENRPLTEFLDSDYTFVNRELARHYDLPVPSSNVFTKVALSDKRRGGLLGQASILTLTANGVDTSPVLRGVWLLENILGSPPAPPPPDVEPLDPDVRGAKSIREQLKKHRDTPACNDCHRRIDPAGFALENYDPVGQWRTRYDKRNTVDASGEFSGKEFQDIRGFKTLLLKKENQFTRALAEKMLAYATGRTTTAADRPAIDSVCRQLAASDNGFRDLVHAIVSCDAFRR